jgi:hypothetical protein
VTRLVLAGGLAVVVLGAAWIAYVRVWRHGDAHPLPYRDESARLGGFETTHAVTRIFRHWSANESAVLIASGPRSSTGYGIDVVSALHERDRILLTVRERTPTLAHPGRARVTYPYRLLVFPKFDQGVRVHVEGRP